MHNFFPVIGFLIFMLFTVLVLHWRGPQWWRNGWNNKTRSYDDSVDSQQSAEIVDRRELAEKWKAFSDTAPEEFHLEWVPSDLVFKRDHSLPGVVYRAELPASNRHREAHL
jgi:hypothetical protein